MILNCFGEEVTRYIVLMSNSHRGPLCVTGDWKEAPFHIEPDVVVFRPYRFTPVLKYRSSFLLGGWNVTAQCNLYSYTGDSFNSSYNQNTWVFNGSEASRRVHSLCQLRVANAAACFIGRVDCTKVANLYWQCSTQISVHFIYIITTKENNPLICWYRFVP